ncbi:MAG: Trm112 family protein [Alphaproteobacteria bacterium]|nr:Trm112 family protein [Alphaproteobacteria bacterium]
MTSLSDIPATPEGFDEGQAQAANPNLQADRALLDLLICPVTRTLLRYDAARQELISDAARLAFPIRGGVPVLVVDDARHF